MRIDKLRKFSDGTLNDVRTALDDILKRIRMKYLPQTYWKKIARFYTLARNPVKESLALTINFEFYLHQQVAHHWKFEARGFEGYLKMEVKVPNSICLTRFIATCSYPTDKYKDIMKAQVHVSRLPLL
ncbi:hypothetical protein Tco_0969350 [Tanacetum coccineum]